MCVAFPGEIIEINGDKAKVNINNNICEANIKLISPKVGDFVLVHAGCVLEILKEERARELEQLLLELEETRYDND